MTKTKFVLGTAALCGTLIGTAASAAPIAPVPAINNANVEQVRWVCGPYRCWWRPNYYYGGPYAYYPRHRWYWRHHHRHHW
ncbi:MAG TPA: hypothetical protein VIV34_07690 [Pseudolabrys sp.]